MNVRLAHPGDVPALLALMVAFNRYEGIAWTPAAGEGPLRTLLADAALGRVLVLEDGDLVGYAVLTYGFDLEWGGRDAFLTELFVREDLRGRGLGPRLLAEAERTAIGEGAGALHLMVRPENGAAVRVYERAGFTSPPRLFLTKRLVRQDGAPTEGDGGEP